MSELTNAQRDKLLTDMRLMVSDVEELLKAGAGDLGEGARGLRERVQQSLGQAKSTLSAAHEATTERMRAAGDAADDFVHENPWRSVALGAGVGLVVGMLIGRR